MLLLEKLKEDYHNIHFLFSPEITDVRPFIRSGFRAFVNYTLLKSLDNLKFDTKLRAREKKAKSSGMIFTWGDTSPDVIKQYQRDFSNYGYSKPHSLQLLQFFKMLIQKGFAKAISARLKGELIASGIILLDKDRKHSRNLLISSEKKHYETGVHSALYINIFKSLKEDGYLSNDLYGANTLGIGNFKSNFTNNLVPHYEVKYNYYRHFLSRGKHDLKKRLMRFITLFR